MGMRWLITGGCGFIGINLIRRLTAEGGHSICVLDNLTVGSREELARVTEFEERAPTELKVEHTGVVLIVGDILDAETAIVTSADCDIIVHLAANTGVAPSVVDPCADCTINVIGTLNILEAARHNDVGRLVFASSGAPLGIQRPPLHEEMAPHPASPYGASKLAGEGYCSAYYHCFGLETVGLRFSNVYGEGSGHKQSVVAKFIKQAMAGDTLEINGDGTQTRDFIYITDLVDAIVRAATVPSIGGELFQIATARETTICELVETLLDALEVEGIPHPKTRFGPKRDGDVMRNFSDTTKVLAFCHFRRCL
jgi:UDP-glucose 4-epimerase